MGRVWATAVLSHGRECCGDFWLFFRLRCWFLSLPFLDLCVTPTSGFQPCLHRHPGFPSSLEPFSFGEVQTSLSRSFGGTLGQGAAFMYFPRGRLRWMTQADGMQITPNANYTQLALWEPFCGPTGDMGQE